MKIPRLTLSFQACRRTYGHGHVKDPLEVFCPFRATVQAWPTVEEGLLPLWVRVTPPSVQNLSLSQLFVVSAHHSVLVPVCPLSPSACAAEPSCHHVALLNTQTQCELYSTHSLNTHCNSSQQVHTYTHTHTQRAVGSSSQPTKSVLTSPLTCLTFYCCNNWRKQVYHGAFPLDNLYRGLPHQNPPPTHFVFKALLFMNFLFSPLKQCSKFSC